MIGGKHCHCMPSVRSRARASFVNQSLVSVVQWILFHTCDPDGSFSVRSHSVLISYETMELNKSKESGWTLDNVQFTYMSFLLRGSSLCRPRAIPIVVSILGPYSCKWSSCDCGVWRKLGKGLGTMLARRYGPP